MALRAIKHAHRGKDPGMEAAQLLTGANSARASTSS
jgi:hypothetical protein